MPERYQPDPWVDAEAYTDSKGTLRCFIPLVALQWIDATPGDVLHAAPKSDSEVMIGASVPQILGGMDVHAKYKGDDIPCRRLSARLKSYLDLSEGDTVRYHKADGDRIRAELLEVDDD